ncbi:MAG: hypothetical protein ACOCRK_06605 [bacterium]
MNKNDLVKKLTKRIERMDQSREKEFMDKHSIAYYKYLNEVFDFLNSFTVHTISWKIVNSGISVYVTAGKKRQRFISIDYLSNDRLKYEFFYPNAKDKLERSSFSRRTRDGGADKHYWYYVDNLLLDDEIKQQIRSSYDGKVTSLEKY